MGFATKQNENCSYFPSDYLEDVELDSNLNCENGRHTVTCEKGTLAVGTEDKSLAPLCKMRGFTSIFTCFTFHPLTVIIYICLVDRITREIFDLLAHGFGYFGKCENYLQILIVCSTIGNVYH